MNALWQDLRFALRTLSRSWPVTLVAGGSLALAIAGNTTVFSFINGMLFRSLPYPEPHRIAFVGERDAEVPRGQSLRPTSAATFREWRERQGAFTSLAAYRVTPFAVGGGAAEPDRLLGATVSPEFFQILGARALHGRLLLSADADDRVAVLSHRWWAERWGSRPGAVGESVELDGEPHEIVGVLSPGFEFLNPTLALFVPFAADRARLAGERDVFGVARLAPGVSDAAAQAEMTALAARLAGERPESDRGTTVDVLNLRRDLPLSRDRSLYYLAQGALLFVLLIACLNLANLLLARGRGRRREIALRASLGAGRGRVARQLFTESLLTAALAGGLGLALAAAGVALLARAVGPLIPRAYAPVIDLRVLAFTLVVTLLGGLFFGLAPVAQSWRLDLVGALKEGARSAATGGRWRRASRLFVAAQMALALVLLAGADVMIRSFRQVQDADPGFDTRRLLTVRLRLPPARYPGDEELRRGVELLAERLRGLPGVTGMTVSNRLPRAPLGAPEPFAIAGRPRGASHPRTVWLSANPEYFAALGIPLVRGRVFTPADRAGAPPVMVINEALARRYWGDEDPLGRRVTFHGRSWEIVGVVATVRHGLTLNDRSLPAAYVPWAQQPRRDVQMALRAGGDAAVLAAAVRRVLRDFDPALAIGEVMTLDDLVARFDVGHGIYSAVLGGFEVLALALAALGVYGVLAYSVAQRRREIGVRLALGADSRQVVGLVLRQALALTALGIAVGLPGIGLMAWGTSRVVAGAAPVAPAVVLGAVLVLFGLAVAAGWLPARRAARVDPIAALRWE